MEIGNATTLARDLVSPKFSVELYEIANTGNDRYQVRVTKQNFLSYQEIADMERTAQRNDNEISKVYGRQIPEKFGLGSETVVEFA